MLTLTLLVSTPTPGWKPHICGSLTEPAMWTVQVWLVSSLELGVVQPLLKPPIDRLGLAPSMTKAYSALLPTWPTASTTRNLILYWPYGWVPAGLIVAHHRLLLT